MLPSLRNKLVGVGVALIVGHGGFAQAQVQEQRALTAVREEIGALKARLDREHRSLEREYGALREAEEAATAALDALQALRQRLADNREQAAELEVRRGEIGERLTEERGALADQVRMSYLTGRQEAVKLLLNQQEPARLGRMMTYYDYLNRARSQRIDAVSAELAALAEIAAAAQRLTVELADLERQRVAEVEALQNVRAERQAAIEDLDAAIRTDEDAVARLTAEEARLTELVQELEAVLAEFPVDSQAPFGEQRGALPWPIGGTALNAFGDARAAGELRWQGVQVAAPAGTAVRSIYHGRVVYSDWLPGLGLLVIVDHGDGYMSLYGHNESLLKEAGEWVTPGEAIAEVGDTGGQAQTALYFEIRSNGDPVDPAAWMARPGPRAR